VTDPVGAISPEPTDEEAAAIVAAMQTVMAGGGIKGGVVYGASDRHAAYPASNATAPVDLLATAYHCLGIAPDTVLHDSQSRPIAICPGTPIGELLT